MTRRLGMFNNVSLDGYFTDADGDMSFAKPEREDAEHADFTRNSARGGSVLVFGRVTYEMMAGFWPTDMAKQMMPEVAKTMNESPKLVFSRTLGSAGRIAMLPGDMATSNVADPWAEAVDRRRRGDYSGAIIYLFAHQLLELDRLGLLRRVVPAAPDRRPAQTAGRRHGTRTGRSVARPQSPPGATG